MNDDQKGFLEEIQSLSEGTKKRVLIIATILIMIIVITVWFAYFNSILGGTSQPSVAQTSATTPAAPAPSTPSSTTVAAAVPVVSQSGVPLMSGPSLWQNIENGFSSFFRSIASIFSGPSNYTIKPQSN